MSFISEEYITPALLKISEYLKMSNTLASVTLLAFANGAGDVITSIVSGAQSEDPSFPLATLYGSGYFVQTAIIACTIFQSKKIIKLDKKDVLRDYGFLLFTNLYIVILALFYKKINIFISCTFYLIYVAYVIIVVVMSKSVQPRISELQTHLVVEASETWSMVE